MPPAASVGPSEPSVARATTSVARSPAMASAAERAISWLRPALPPPRTVTVVSPPRMRQAGGAEGPPAQDEPPWPGPPPAARRRGPPLQEGGQQQGLESGPFGLAPAPRGRRRPGCPPRPWRRARRGDRPAWASPAPRPVAPARASPPPPGHLLQQIEAAQDVQGVGEGGGVRHGGAGGDEVQGIADHVREDQGGHLGRGGRAAPGARPLTCSMCLRMVLIWLMVAPERSRASVRRW